MSTNLCHLGYPNRYQQNTMSPDHYKLERLDFRVCARAHTHTQTFEQRIYHHKTKLN